MAGASDHPNIHRVDAVSLHKVFAYHQARFGDDPLDSRENDLVLEWYREFGKLRDQKSRRNHENHIIRPRHSFIDVAGQMDFVRMQFHRGEVVRVMFVFFDMRDSQIVAHIPSNLREVLTENLYDSRRPATTTKYCIFHVN